MGASLIAQLVKNPPAMQETLIRFLGWEDLLEKDRLPTPVFLGYRGGSDGKESKNPLAMWETWVRSLVGKICWRRERLLTAVFWPGEFYGLYTHWVTKSQTQLSDFPFHFLGLPTFTKNK